MYNKMKAILLEIKGFIHSLLSSDGISSKRAAGLIGMLSLIGLMWINVISGNVGPVTIALIDAVLYLTIASFLGTSIEKIWPRSPKSNPES